MRSRGLCWQRIFKSFAKALTTLIDTLWSILVNPAKILARLTKKNILTKILVKLAKSLSILSWSAHFTSCLRISGVIFSRDALTPSNLSVDIKIFLPVRREDVTWRCGCVHRVFSEGQEIESPLQHTPVLFSLCAKIVVESCVGLDWILYNLAYILVESCENIWSAAQESWQRHQDLRKILPKSVDYWMPLLRHLTNSLQIFPKPEDTRRNTKKYKRNFTKFDCAKRSSQLKTFESW